MVFRLEAACLCDTGRLRKNNEDNFYFNGQCLPVENRGLSHPLSGVFSPGKNAFFAVFDGMGGENYGEYAAFAAADCLRSLDGVQNGAADKAGLEELCLRLNDAVVETARKMSTGRMGATLAALSFTAGAVAVCNLGDSRAFRFRDGVFLQLSVDHVSSRMGRSRAKAPLIQYLGIDPEEVVVEPYIAGEPLASGDWYLLCSDGLTDMLSNLEIVSILSRADTAAGCAEELVRAALDRGGRDNVTVITIRAEETREQ